MLKLQLVARPGVSLVFLLQFSMLLAGWTALLCGSTKSSVIPTDESTSGSASIFSHLNEAVLRDRFPAIHRRSASCASSR